MNQYRNTDKDIHTRIYKFIVGCFGSVVRKIPKTPENLPIIGQVSSSLTSMGANDREADGAGSRRDFLSKYTIVRKETKETHYWLCLIRDTGMLPSLIVDPYIQECEEIGKIVSKIMENTRR